MINHTTHLVMIDDYPVTLEIDSHNSRSSWFDQFGFEQVFAGFKLMRIRGSGACPE
jgi:hypothetical protein